MYLIIDKLTGEILARVNSIAVAYKVAHGELGWWEVK